MDKQENPNIKPEILSVLKEEQILPQKLPNPLKLSNIILYYHQIWKNSGTESDSDNNLHHNNNNKKDKSDSK